MDDIKINQFLNSVFVKENIELYHLMGNEKQNLVLSSPGDSYGYQFYQINFQLQEDGTLDFNSIQVTPIEDIFAYCDTLQVKNIVPCKQKINRVDKNGRK